VEKAVKRVSAREANQRFSRILSQVTAGEEVVITKRGQPVARLVPYVGENPSPERLVAIDRLLAMLRKGFPLGNIRATRDEMHER
jgi:prevent-host-death family protein